MSIEKAKELLEQAYKCYAPPVSCTRSLIKQAISELEQKPSEEELEALRDRGLKELGVLKDNAVILDQIARQQEEIGSLESEYKKLELTWNNSIKRLDTLEVENKRLKDGKCEWKHDEYHDMWETSCGDAYTTIDGALNKIKYCPFCGKEIEVIKEIKENKNGKV